MPARYTILRELGRGQIGTVYAASDRETGSVVALKTLDPALLNTDAGLAERFLKHAASARALSHRNIVRIHDAGEIAGTVYVAMELLEGESLQGLLDSGPLAIARALRITRDIASGLGHAHLDGVVHGGLKPSNVVVLRSGIAKITDFGVGQLGQAQPCLSPEQARGDPVDHRSDIFSLGALLYEMLAGRPPFEGDSPKQTMENILHAEPAPPSRLNQHVPYALDALVLGMLARQPADRLPGVPVVLRELQRVEDALGLGPGATTVADEPTAGALPSDRTTDREELDYQKAMALMERESRAQRSSRSGPSIFAALALVLAAASIGLTGFMYYSSSTSALPLAPLPTNSPVAEAAVPPALAEPAPAPAPEPVRVVHPVAKEPEQQAPGANARLVLSVSPRGEIYIDGEHHGTTPPITTLDLEPGIHRVEVRSGSRKPYLTYMTVQPGDERHIRHDFNAKPNRRPPPG